MELNSRTVMALAGAVNYRAGWQEKFSEELTREGVFHGTAGDTVCSFMNDSRSGYYYWTENFSAVPLELCEGGKMWLVLPNENRAADEILAGEEVYELFRAQREWERKKYLRINLSVPKFDAVSDMDLTDGCKALGVTDVFDAGRADFSGLAEKPGGIYLSQAKHAVRVRVDEKGVEAAAYTVMAMEGAGALPEEEAEFVLDRPFLFAVTSGQGILLFMGTVNNMGE